MAEAAEFTVMLEPELRATFMAEVEASRQPAEQVVGDLMRAFIEQQKERRLHADFLQRKVEIARASIRDGRGRSNEAVKADFAARRARAIDRA